jgi:phosphoglycerol transferase
MWWLPGSIFSLLLASVLKTGWSGLLSVFSYPFQYEGDALFSSSLVQRLIEGWAFENPRQGYPFGSTFLDFPMSEAGLFLVQKLIGLFAGNFYSTLNIFFLFGFFITFAAAFCVLRTMHLSLPLSLSCATLFNFIPFHMARAAHLALTWYFVVPIYFYLAFLACSMTSRRDVCALRLRRNLPIILGIMALSSFGVYYSFFGVIVVFIGGVLGAIQTKTYTPLVLSIVFAVVTGIGLCLNISPNIYNIIVNGKNPEVAQRTPIDSEVYGLKLTGLLLPHNEHRIGMLSRLSSWYSQKFPLNNENRTASLGIVGSLGFLCLGLVIFFASFKRICDYRIIIFALISYSLFMIGTIGGLSAFFAIFITPMIRCWNRISVFIAFSALAGFFFVIESWLKKIIPLRRLNMTLWGFALAIVSIGLLDQTFNANKSSLERAKKYFLLDRTFYQKIESVMPKSSSIYQLPYRKFPECPPTYRLPDYEMLSGFVHTHHLRWSHGGTKGREGDLFFRSLSQKPIEFQLDIISQLGFSGITIDRRGFADNGQSLITTLKEVLGPSFIEREDGEVVFFPLRSVSKVNLDGLPPLKIMLQVGYVVDRFGSRHKATLKDGIDFSRGELPAFVKNISGLSGVEPWGRWSDAGIAPSVRIDFFEPLTTNFMLRMTLQPFGPNTGRDMPVQIGSRRYLVNLQGGTFNLEVHLDGEKASFIEFFPPQPISPAALGLSTDDRKLGVGFIKLIIDEM